MRKFFYSLSLILFFYTVNGQNSMMKQEQNSAHQFNELSTSENLKLRKMAKTQEKLFYERENSSKTLSSKWFNAGVAAKSIYGGGSKVWVSALFPDTTILYNYSNGAFHPWIHAIAETFDPSSDLYSGGSGLHITKQMSYTVDSIGIYAIYSRKTANTIVDTLLIQIKKAPTAYWFWIATQSSWLSNYSTDTLAYRPVYYDLGKNYSTKPGVVTIKYPLNAAAADDTLSSGWNYYKVAPPSTFNLDAGEQFIVNMSFIPGYTWLANTDTLNLSKNTLRFVSYEENGNNSYPNYLKWDWTCSSIQSSSKLYSTQADDSKRIYSPSYSFVQGYRYEHHWIEAKLSATDNTSLNSSVNNSEIKLYQNYPNPSNGITNISYYLNQASKTVNFKIYNISGKEINTSIFSNVNMGKHNFRFDVSNLASGVYYYTLEANNTKVTKKMIVY